jgi:hypothetical protein
MSARVKHIAHFARALSRRSNGVSREGKLCWGARSDTNVTPGVASFDIASEQRMRLGESLRRRNDLSLQQRKY